MNAWQEGQAVEHPLQSARPVVLNEVEGMPLIVECDERITCSVMSDDAGVRTMC